MQSICHRNFDLSLELVRKDKLKKYVRTRGLYRVWLVPFLGLMLLWQFDEISPISIGKGNHINFVFRLRAIFWQKHWIFFIELTYLIPTVHFTRDTTTLFPSLLLLFFKKYLKSTSKVIRPTKTCFIIASLIWQSSTFSSSVICANKQILRRVSFEIQIWHPWVCHTWCTSQALYLLKVVSRDVFIFGRVQAVTVFVFRILLAFLK